MTDETARRFIRVKTGLARSDLFMAMSGVMMMGKTELSDDIPTACTDGRNEWYGRQCIDESTDKEVGFYVAHENFHKACRHMIIYQQLWEVDAQLISFATDYWINGTLVKLDPNEILIAMPRKNGERMGLYDERFYDEDEKCWMSVPQIFRILLAEKKKKGKCRQGEGEGEGQGKGKGGNGSSPNGGGDQSRGKSGHPDLLDKHDWEGAAKLTKEEQKELATEVGQAIRQGVYAAKKAGLGTGGLAIELDEMVTPKVNWKDQLKQFINASCNDKDISSWRRPNRRFLHDDIIMPTLEGETIKELVVAVDASGSMYFDNEFTKAMSEVKGMATTLKVDKVHLLYWDGEVDTPHEVYDSSTFANVMVETEPVGGGGTTPACIPAYMKEQGITPDCVIVLTDGDVCGWGKWSVPVMWAIVGDPHKHRISPVGKTIHVEEENANV